MPAVQGSAPASSGGGAGTPAEILAALLTTDGAASGLDADLIDGLSSAAFQLANSDLTDLIARWVPASAAGPASLDFFEDTDNGSNKGTLIAPASLTADRVWTLPDASVTLGPDKLGLTPTAVKTANYSAAAGDFVPCDTSGGAFAVTFPTAPADGTVVAVKLVTAGNTLTLTLGGSDVFNKAGGSASGSLSGLNQAIVCQYKASSAIWYVVADDLPKTYLDTLYIPNSLVDAAGDLITAAADNVPSRLAKGTALQVLRVNSGATALEWGPGPGMELIAESILGASATTIDIQSIPATYKDLVIFAVLRSDAAGTSLDNLAMRLNNDSSGVYDSNRLWTYSSGATLAASLTDNGSSFDLGAVLAATATASRFSTVEITVFDYASTTRHKGIAHEVQAVNSGSNANAFWARTVGVWGATAAVNRITLLPSTGPNFIAGSQIRIYGTKGA